MARKNKEGFFRFSSYHDVQRALSSYTPEMVNKQVETTNNRHSDSVLAMLVAQRFVDEVKSITAQALSACYASDVVNSVPEGVDISETRTTFINRIRKFAHLNAALDKQLAHIASLQVSRRKLTIPQFADTIIKDKCKAENVLIGWKIVPNKDKQYPYKLFRIYEMSNVQCYYVDNAGIDNYVSDKLIGIALPEYNKTNKEISMFVMDKDDGKYPEIVKLNNSKRREQFINTLQANGIKVG